MMSPMPGSGSRLRDSVIRRSRPQPVGHERRLPSNEIVNFTLIEGAVWAQRLLRFRANANLDSQ